MAEMTDIDGLPGRVERIEQKLDALSHSVDKRFADIDKRFDEVSEHFTEQRQYTEFAFDKLRGEMAAGFTRLGRLIAANTDGLARLERLIAANTDGLARLGRKFDQFVDNEDRHSRRRRSGRLPKKR